MSQEVASILAQSFARDGILGALFGSTVGRHAFEFFACLVRARISAGSPVILSIERNRVIGVAMGDTPDVAEWTSESQEEWNRLAATWSSLARERLAEYHSISNRYAPSARHHYLGSLGVHPAHRSRGHGAMLLQAFCELARFDSRSRGVYLETANPEAHRFYLKRGFQETGQASLGGIELVCMYWPWPQGR